MGRDERGAARGGAERMHGGCRLGERPPLDRPRRWGRGAGLTGTPSRRGKEGLAWLAVGAGGRSRNKDRRGFGWPAGRHGAG